MSHFTDTLDTYQGSIGPTPDPVACAIWTMIAEPTNTHVGALIAEHGAANAHDTDGL